MAQGHTLLLRRGLASVWAAKNPVLADGEPGFEKDTGKLKIGDGVSRWTELKYFIVDEPQETPTNLADHIIDENPHPVYDDGSSFELLYQNAKV